MSSSYRLQKRREDGVWDIDRFGVSSELDMYIRVNGECLTGFTAHSIGSVTGPKICVRDMKAEQKRPPMHPRKTQSRNEASYGNVDLYNPTASQPRQVSDPRSFQQRRNPYEESLVRDDYVATSHLYDGTGLYERSQYAPSFRSNYDHLSQAPPKLDVTQMTDRYAVWKTREVQRKRNGVVETPDA